MARVIEWPSGKRIRPFRVVFVYPDGRKGGEVTYWLNSLKLRDLLYWQNTLWLVAANGWEGDVFVAHVRPQPQML